MKHVFKGVKKYYLKEEDSGSAKCVENIDSYKGRNLCKCFSVCRKFHDDSSMNIPRVEVYLGTYNAHYPSISFKPVLFLDNHDTDRFLYHCNGYVSLKNEAIQIMKQSSMPYILYYGTEKNMYNSKSIINAESYADIRVREPMNWAELA